MQIIETTLRPARIAFAFTPEASSRVLRRAFRLAGGRWGGRYDALICMDADGPPSDFNAAALSAVDPDYILLLDPRLDGYDFDAVCRDFHIQPFEIVRFRERMEDRQTWRWLFRETPTVPDTAELTEGTIDIDVSGVRWGRAAQLGFPLRTSEYERVSSTSARAAEVPTPLARSQVHLSSPIENVLWLFYGPRSDVVLASEYWTIRSLGKRVAWRGVRELQNPQLPEALQRSARVYLRASGQRLAGAHAAAANWTSGRRPVLAAPFPMFEAIGPGAAGAVFAQQILPVIPHGNRLRFPTPPPPVVPRLPDLIDGVAVHRVLSPDADDPDGVVLSRDPESRALVQAGAAYGRRITRGGVAERMNIARPQLIDLPLVHYEDAVSAPLRAVGYQPSHSDKGRYHQRTLQLSRGLLFLSWVLRQPQSAHLLDLFLEHPDGAPAAYRRAATFDDLRTQIHTDARGTRSRLRDARRSRADAWLKDWTNEMLERELLLVGYLLDCPDCSDRSWYRGRDVDQHFACSRCDAVSVVPAAAIRAFRLNEAFFVFRQQGGHAVTFALARLRRAASESFLYFPETLVVHGNGKREVDAVALIDGRLAIVEAKTNNDVTQSEVNYYCGLAKQTRASRLVFATASRSRQDCGTTTCACLGQETRDHAWGDGARIRIAAARHDLAPHGIAVESWCFQDLVIEPQLEELGPFVRSG